MQPSWALPKLLWLIRTHHRLIPHARLAHQSDFINSRLAGQLLPSDSSNALKTGYDLLQETWPADVFDALGIPDHLLPGVVRSGTQIGVVCQQAAEITGIPAGTPISAGMTDGCAAQIGAGALQPGNWNSVLGTTLVLKGVTRRLLRDPQGALYCHRSPDGDWLPGGASSTGAGVLAKEFPGRDLAALSARAAERGPATVVRYPLISRGERFPFIAPDAEGFCLGDPADEVDRFAALLEGVAFIERLCFDYLDMLGAPLNGNLSFTGGGARNRYWRQLRADVLGRAVRLPQNSEPAFGMAVLAAAAGRRLSDVAREMVGTAEGIEPQPHNSDHFCESYLRLVHELDAAAGFIRISPPMQLRDVRARIRVSAPYSKSAAMTRVILIGAGKGGAALLELFHKDCTVEIVGVADKDPLAPGAVLAKEFGLPVSGDYRQLVSTHAADLVINVTGDPDVAREIYNMKSENMEVLGGNAARFMWEVIEARNRSEALEDKYQLVLRELESRAEGEFIIGNNPKMKAISELIAKVAPAPTTVLIRGESGTGKELVARAIHRHSALSNQPLVTLNCTALSPTLLESELFGYKRGAFTGAYTDRKGLFEKAHGGTMFLDEIGDMSVELQA